jgi:uncharacterized protein YbjT (DUF2867 family)
VVREVDHSRPDTLGPAVEGIRTLLLVSGTEVGQRVRQHTAVIQAARDAGVERIALDESIARGELETDGDDLARLLGRPATSLRAASRSARP